MTNLTNSGNYAWEEGGEIFVKSVYDGKMVEDFREITGRRWDGNRKVNIFPHSSLNQIRALAPKWGITLGDELEVTGPMDFTDSKRTYNVEVVDGKIVICFDYNPSLINSIKSHVPSAKWDPKERAWKVPERDFVDVIRFSVASDFTLSPELNKRVSEVIIQSKEMREASESLSADIEIPGIAVPLLPYQKAGVAYMQKVRKGIIGDQPGLGKTAQAIATIVLENQFPLIVVCPNTLKINWEREVKKFFPNLTTSILTGGKSATIEKSDVIIVNYDILYQRNDDIIEHGFLSLVVDESHAIKNGQKKHNCPECAAVCRSNATNCAGCGARGIKPVERWTVKRTDAVMRLAKLQGPNDFTLLLTGTPITNRPDELIPQLEAVRCLDRFGGAWRFKNRYAPKRNMAINTLELNNKMREMCFVRRVKKDVYGELPPLRNAVQYLSIEDKKMNEYRIVENDVVEYFAQRAKDLAEEEGSDGTDAYWRKKIALENSVNLVRITALRDAVSKIKFDSTSEWIDNFLESSDGEKVIVFAEHIDLVEKLYDRYKDVAVKIRGGVSVADRQDAVDKFQTDPKCRVFVANMTSASEGLTLPAARDVVFCELGWTPAIHEQCVSRAYGRVNDMHGATAWYLLAPQTIDEDIYSLLEKKRKIVDSVTDGIDVEEQGSLIGELVKTLADRGMKNEGLS